MIAKMMAKEPEDRYQIPLLVVAPLRKYCIGSAGSSGVMVRPSLTGVNTNLVRPGSALNLTRPSSSPNLPRG
jgi:hypothetical protein